MIAFVFVIFLCVTSISADKMLERAQAAGASIECHYVTTEDGYILRLYHIPPMPNTSIESNKTKTIFFMHGLQSSSLDYVIYPNISLGFYFSQRGYSVWLGNARGNTFSRNHTKLDPNEKRFWKFSFNEIALNDLPAMIDYILNHTNEQQLIYGGHSQGGNIIFILLSERPEYNAKIALVHGMAPAVLLVKSDANPMLNILLDNLDNLKDLAEQIQFYEINSFRRNSKVLQPLGQLCTDPMVAQLCRTILSQLFGPFAPGSYYNELLRDYSSINPSGSSYMQYVHFGQLYVAVKPLTVAWCLCRFMSTISIPFALFKCPGRFQKYDYGPFKNMRLYNRTKPPEYNLSNVRTKVHLLYGTNDNLVVPEGILKLISKIERNVVAVDEIAEFNHLDFVMGHLVHKIQPIILRVINAHT